MKVVNMRICPEQTISRRLRVQILFWSALLFLVSAVSPAAAQQVNASYLYDLASFTGGFPYSWARIDVDQETNEIYMVYQNLVTIFNSNGMEVYRFGDDLTLGVISDAVAGPGGNIFLLVREGDRFNIWLCNFRGKPISKIELQDIPPEFAKASPSRIFYRADRLYLPDFSRRKVVVVSSKGEFVEGINIPVLLNLKEKAGQENQIGGFSVDAQGNMLFTLPTLFRAFRISPDREVASFGQAGSIAGKFNVVSGIVSDDQGNVYVADTLRCVIMIFDKNLNFMTEFSNRGLKPGELIAPKGLAVDKAGRVYVSQSRRRGVSVFKVSHD